MPAAAAKSSNRSSQTIQDAFLSQCGGDGGDAARSFIGQALADWGDAPMPGWSETDMAVLACELWAAAREASGKPLVRLRRQRGPTGLDLLEIVQDDAPFLVSSLMGEVVARGADVRAMIHPVVEIDGRRRSLMQVAMTPIMDSKALIEGVGLTLADVHAAVADFSAMTQTMSQAIDELEASGKATSEEIAFLRWVDGGRFVFQGLRIYDYPEGGPAAGPDWRPNASLGVLRDPKRQVLRQGNEPSILAAIARRRRASHPSVTVAKSNLRSRVHRRVHMDYVGIERYDERGKAVGEMRVVGLFTAEAYSLPVDQTPLIRAKTQAVFERADLPKAGH